MQVIAGSRQTEWRPSAVPPARARRTTCRAAEKETVPESVQEVSTFFALTLQFRTKQVPECHTSETSGRCAGRLA